MDKLLKALDEVVAWFKKEGAVVEDDVHAALAALHLKHGPVDKSTQEPATETATDEETAK